MPKPRRCGGPAASGESPAGGFAFRFRALDGVSAALAGAAFLDAADFFGAAAFFGSRSRGFFGVGTSS